MRLFILSLLFLIPFTASAAELQIARPNIPIHAGDTFSAVVSLNTGVDTVNAIEGTVRIPAGLKLSSVRLSGSIVPLWVTPPQVGEGNTVSFAGVLPGGFQGGGTLFTLVLKAQKMGQASLSFGSDTKAYSNDGNGTEIKLIGRGVSISIEKLQGAPSKNILPADSVSPESFTPIITSGEPFTQSGMVLVFATQDKDSGVMKYEVASSYDKHVDEKNLHWKETISPYVLVSGDSSRFLFVRATDYDGNTRVARVSPRELSPLAFLVSWWMPILIALLVLVILSRRLFRRS